MLGPQGTITKVIRERKGKTAKNKEKTLVFDGGGGKPR
jgi:hypothetical protein